MTAAGAQRSKRIMHTLSQGKVLLTSLVLHGTIACKLLRGDSGPEIFGHGKQYIAEEIAMQIIGPRQVLVENALERGPVSTEDHCRFCRYSSPPCQVHHTLALARRQCIVVEEGTAEIEQDSADASHGCRPCIASIRGA